MHINAPRQQHVSSKRVTNRAFIRQTGKHINLSPLEALIRSSFIVKAYNCRLAPPEGTR